MKKDDVLKLARESGLIDPMIFGIAYDRFARLVYEKAKKDCLEELKKIHEEYGEDVEASIDYIYNRIANKVSYENN